MRCSLFAALLTLGGLLGATSTAWAQTVQGRVLDGTNQPVIGAYLTNGVVTVATDMDGAYTLELKPGQHTIMCTFIGMSKQEFKVELTAGQTAQWNPVMTSAAEALGLVVVSAGRFEQDASEVTVSLEVLKPALVENKATTTLETAIEQTPGVSLVDGEPQIRSGSGFSYGAGSRVMVLVDDLPVLSGDAGRPTWGFLPLENLEQIEVIKGASSVLYGSAALSGVINIRTRYPDARPLTRVSLQHGVYSDPRSADESKYWDGTLQQSNLRFLHSQQLGGWDVVIGGNLLGDDGFKGPEIYQDSVGGALVPVDTASMNYNPFNVNRFGANSQGRFNVNLRRRDTGIEGLKFGLNTNWQYGESLNTLIWERAYDGLYGSTDGAATRTRQLVGTVDPYIEYLSPRGTQHSFRNRWQHLNNNNDNGQSNTSNVFYSEYQVQQRGDVWGMDGLVLTAGAVQQLTRGTAELYNGGNPEGINTATNRSAYLQIDQKAGERLNLSAGTRYEHFSINDSTAAKPVFRAGLNFQAAEASWFRASVGQGFRFPTIAEKFIRTGLGPLQVYPNNELRPETAINIEAGFKQGLRVGGFQGFLDVAGFYQEYDNFIEFTFGQWGNPLTDPLAGNGFRSLNTGSSRVTGWEASLMGRATWGETTLDVLAGYTYTNPVSLTPDYLYSVITNAAGDTIGGASYNNTSLDTTGQVLKYRSQDLVRFDAELRRGPWFIGASARYQSALQNIDAAWLLFEQLGVVDWGLETWLADNPKLPWIWDFRAGINLSDHHKMSLVVSNLTNAEYSIRPLAIESPRLVNLVYTYELK
ncbi:MAG: TonB-dependent receptor [Flavobacteriales bacterium]